MEKGLKHVCGVGIALVLLVCGSAMGQATAVTEDVKATLEALQQRIRDQDRRLAELEKNENSVEYAKRRQEEMRKVVKEIVDEAAKTGGPFAGSDWMKDLKFAGDFRLRYEGNFFNWDKTADDEKKNRNRARFRLRFGFVKSWPDEDLTVGFRLASGENNDATSTNQSFTDNWSKKPVWIDQAWAKWSPRQVKGLTVVGGKMETPWIENEIFLDRDVNPEGFWAEYKTKCGAIEPFVGAGYFVLRESADDFDTTVGIFQAGVRAELAKDVKYTVAGFYYDYDHYSVSGANPRGNDDPLERIPNFHVVGVANSLDMLVFGRPLSFFADFAHNFDNQDVRADYGDASNAFAAGVKYGQNKKKGDWSVKYRYAWIEANALPGNFVDSDFGFANRKGHVIGGEYNILDHLTAGVSVFLTQPIFDPVTTSPGKSNGPFEDMTATVLFDVVWKF